jgi:hypothetical protein
LPGPSSSLSGGITLDRLARSTSKLALLLRTSRNMGETADQLKQRTMRFALDVCALIRELPRFEPGLARIHRGCGAAQV